MKKTILIITSLVIITSAVFPQSKMDINNLIDRGGVLYAPNKEKPYSGSIFELYDNGQKKLNGRYRRGLKNDKWTWWSENGKIDSSGTFKNGIKNGKWTEWYKNGQKDAEGTWKDGKEDGLWTSWRENGQKIEEGTYKDGEQDGKWTWYNEDGLQISLDEYLVKSLPVIPKIIIHTEPGFIQVGEINISPHIIDVAGPRELVESLQWMTTEAETLSALKEPVRDGSLTIQSPHLLMEYKNRFISYEIDIQKIGEHIIYNIPVHVTRVPDGLRVFVNPRTVSLTVVGGVLRIADIYPEDFFIYVDFKDQWSQKKQFYAPTVVIPKDVIEWQDLSPRSIELVVTRDSE
jgi:antitoxin component YwqK of YwqJK toxin-antitoxin module